MRDGEASYELLDGEPLELIHHGERVTVEPGKPLRLAVPPPPSWPEPRQPAGARAAPPPVALRLRS